MIPLGSSGRSQDIDTVAASCTTRDGTFKPAGTDSAVVPSVASDLRQANSVHTSTWETEHRKRLERGGNGPRKRRWEGKDENRRLFFN